MVGPTRQEVEAPTDYGQLKWGFAALIAVSGGLIAVHGGASVTGIVLATVVAGFVGLVLMQYVFWSLS